MRDTTKNTGLKTIFSFFLGLMLTSFVGVGVYTFHPPPDRFDARMDELTKDEQAIRGSKAYSELLEEERAEIDEIRRQRGELLEQMKEARKGWCLSTSIILIVFSTLTLVVSLVRAEQLQVISNGLLLGGVFTMLYGVGWIAFTGTSVLRFVVMTVALAITLGLGYVRFVRRGRVSPAAAGAAVAGGTGLEELEERVGELERRLAEAAGALGRKGDPPLH